MTKQQELKKKIQTQNMIIIALVIIILVLVSVSSTAAWYIRTKSDAADIILSNPVNIYITEFENKTVNGVDYIEHTTTEDILKQYNSRIYPGDRIKLRLGMQIGSLDLESSDAYVRVKLETAFAKIEDGVEQDLQVLADDGLIEYQNKPDENVWQLVDFNIFNKEEIEEAGEQYVPDYWYVLKTTTNGVTTSRIATNMEKLEFIDGYIKLSKTKVTNAQANCRFHINYVVEAIQTVNVPDPLVYEGYGPWWSFALGDLYE